MTPQGPHFSPHSTLKPTIKIQISGRMASIGIGNVVTASVHSGKKCLKKLMTMIGRAKQALHWGVQSRFRVIYISMSIVSQNA